MVPTLISILVSVEDGEIRREAAAEALGYIGDQSSAEPLLQYLDVDPDRHTAAKHALVRIGAAAVSAIERHRNSVSLKKLKKMHPVYDELLAQIRSTKAGGTLIGGGTAAVL
jgi:HEAT repeat protein